MFSGCRERVDWEQMGQETEIQTYSYWLILSRKSEIVISPWNGCLENNKNNFQHGK